MHRKNPLFIFVFMLNLRGYRALCQNSGRHWRRNAQCPHAIDHARPQSVSHETSYVGLWAQPINGSGDDCGLCTTPLECPDLDTLHPIHRIGNGIARDVRRESNDDDFASERNVEKKKKKSSRLKINSGQEMENRSQEILVPPPHASSYNPHDASPTRLSVKVENNKKLSSW